ncbi:hypothetical protein M9458_044395, partial [Cirrhinus mrigala]
AHEEVKMSIAASVEGLSSSDAGDSAELLPMLVVARLGSEAKLMAMREVRFSAFPWAFGVWRLVPVSDAAPAAFFPGAFPPGVHEELSYVLGSSPCTLLVGGGQLES